MEKNWSTELKLELLNKKMDMILEQLQHIGLKKKKEISTETTWSIEESDEGVFVKISYNNPEMKEFVKSLGAKWYFKKKSWILPNKGCIEQIKEKYPVNENSI